ncbi:hypothetical protein BJV77DRAFT_479507 [Russula vinacea]|nr:hypothetical protein BJV77DRAFT_479507 [Russula vinacea]
MLHCHRHSSFAWLLTTLVLAQVTNSVRIHHNDNVDTHKQVHGSVNPNTVRFLSSQTRTIDAETLAAKFSALWISEMIGVSRVGVIMARSGCRT